MILQASHLALPENTWQFFSRLQAVALDYVPCSGQEYINGMFRMDNPSFLYWHGRRVQPHSDGIDALRVFWILDNQLNNWVIRGEGQHTAKQPPGTVLVLDVGKHHGVWGNNPMRRPWIALSYGELHEAKHPRVLLDEAITAFSGFRDAIK